MLDKIWVRNLIITAGVLVFLVLIFLLRNALAPVFIALAIAYVGDPIIDKFESWKISRTWGILILIALFLIASLGLAFYLIPKLISQVNDLAKMYPVYKERLLEFWNPFAQTHSQEISEYRESAIAWLQENAGILAKNVSLGLASSFKSIGAFLANIVGLLIVPVLAFYLLRDFDIMKEKVANLIPVKRKAYIVGLFKELDEALGNFIQGQLLVAVILSIIYSIGLTIAGCPASLLIGILAGFSNLVPYLGIALGLLPAVLLTYLTGNPTWQILLAGLTFVIGQLLEGMVITPKVVGESVGLHPALVLIALMVFGSYFGMVGMILALPSCAVLMVFAKRAYGYYVGSILYHEGDQAGEPPPAEPA